MIYGFLNKNEKNLDRSFNFTFRYIDDVLSLNSSKFGDFVDRIYPIDPEIKDNKGNNKITELRTILQRESQNS
jgi:hypothetical protein